MKRENFCRILLVTLALLVSLPTYIHAASINPGETKIGNIVSSGQTDSYSFSANAGDTVTILIGVSSGSLDPQVELHAPDGTVVKTAWGGSSATIQAQKVNQTGTYYIICRDYYGTYTGGYGVSLTLIPGTTPYSYTVTTSPSGLQITVDGSPYTAPQTFSWPPGSTHTLSVLSPQSGTSGTRYVYSSWSDGGGQTHQITVPSSNTIFTATFTTQYLLGATVTPIGSGVITINPSGPWYNSGQTVQLTATANSGYTFSGWSGDLSGTANPATITMNVSKTVTANFSQGCVYTLTVNINPPGSGTVTKNPDKSGYCPGDQVTLTATANSGYTFNSWSGVDSSSGTTAYVTMNSNKNVTANFSGAEAAWPMFMHDPQRSGRSHYLGPQSEALAWVFREIPVYSGWGVSQPVIGFDGTIYVYTSGDNNLYAIGSGGNIEWKVRTGGDNFSPAIGTDGTIYMPGSGLDGYELLALDPATGLTKWSYPLGLLSSSPAIGPDGVVYVGSESLYAVNPDGTLKWKCDEVSMAGSIAIGPDGTIYVRDNTSLAAINPDGSLKWRITAGNISGSPALGPDSTIYLPVGSSLYAISPDDGVQKWIFTNPYCWTSDWRGIAPIAVAPDGTVYSAICEFLYAVNPSGELKWHFEFGSSSVGYYNNPTIDSEGTIYIGTGDGVYAINADGTLKWKYNATAQSGGFLWSSIGLNGHLYVMSAYNGLYAFYSTSGTTGTANRDLPDCYTPSATSTVTISVTPSGTTQTYAIEETPPNGWTVSNINENGQWDNVNKKVKWGPFFDHNNRTFTYNVTPPSGETGSKTFSGTASFDGTSVSIGGESTVGKCVSGPHPADTNNDYRMAINEVTAYGSAWKTGQTWPTPPTPILIEYVTNSGYLWKMGEVYHYDGSVNPPWVPGAASSLSMMSQISFQDPIASETGSGIRTLPRTYGPSVAVSVSISVNPGQGTQVYAVEETPPNGWAISDINEGGQWDSVNKKVKWGPFFDDNIRTLTYKATPPVGETGAKTFSGTVSFDGNNVSIGGN